MQNRIHYANNEHINKIVEKYQKFADVHLAVIHGKEIQSWQEYINKMEDAYKLPTQWVNTIDGYNDWMRDLEWLGNKSYILIIYDFKYFFEHDFILKKTIIEGFEKIILPWWQAEVEKCVVGGKAKPFNIYLID